MWSLFPESSIFFSWCRIWCLAGLIVLNVVTTNGWCETTLTPSVRARGTYDDNTLGKGKSDFEVLLSPVLRLETGSELTQLTLDGRLDVFRYAENNEYERENIWVNANVQHALTERLRLRLEGKWVRDHTVEQEFDESGLVTEVVPRNTYILAPGLTYLLSERDELSVDISASQVDYERSLYTDYHVFGLTANWSRALGDGRWRILGQVGGEQYRFDRPNGKTDQQVLTGMAGLSWQATELLELRAMSGVSYVSSRMDFDWGGEIDEDRKTFSGSFSGTWTDEVWRLTLTADRSESPSSYGQLMTRDRLRAVFGYSMSERLSFGAQAAWYQSKVSGLAEKRDVHTYVFGPNMRYRLSENSIVEAGYLFSREDNKHSDRVTDRNRIYLNFSRAFPFLL